MNWRTLALLVAGSALLTLLYAAKFALNSSQPELWYQSHSYMTTDDSLDNAKKLVDQAVAAGYSGAVIWDTSIFRLDEGDVGKDIASRYKELMNHARKRKLKVVVEAAPFGWSNEVLAANPNWAESQRVIGTRLKVAADGGSLDVVDTFPGLVNGDFESGQTGWFEMGDPNVTIGLGAHSGKGAATITDPPGNARLRQKLSVHPWRQYHLSLFYRAVGKGIGSPIVQVLDAADTNKSRMVTYLHDAPQWQELHFLFNSGESSELNLYMGVWGGAQGTIQFDDVKLEETGLVYVERRETSPFRIYDPEHPETVYKAGGDYNDARDPALEPQRPCFQNRIRLPLKITLPKSTRLKPGQIVAVDYEGVSPLPHEQQISMCLSEPGVYRWVARNAELMKKMMPKDQQAAVLLIYDELRQANSCALCRSKNMTAGGLLAQSFDKTQKIFHDSLPESELMVWSDMFDPYHNAHENFYLVEGTLAGSWKALPRDVVILNWNLDHLKESLKWFSGQNSEQPVAHQQIIAGFYDKGDAAAEARRELQEAEGVPGVRGLMYTTWVDDFSKMKQFADAAKEQWPSYRASVEK